MYIDAIAISEYGGGSGPIYYSNVLCTGNEARLVDCIIFDGVFCYHYEDAGVRCPSDEIVIHICHINFCFSYLLSMSMNPRRT